MPRSGNPATHASLIAISRSALCADRQRSPPPAATQINRLCATANLAELDSAAVHIGGYACASYANGGGGASRVPRIAGGVTAGSALSAACWLAMRRTRRGAACDLLWRG